jgi:hypothetical protein
MFNRSKFRKIAARRTDSESGGVVGLVGGGGQSCMIEPLIDSACSENSKKNLGVFGAKTTSISLFTSRFIQEMSERNHQAQSAGEGASLIQRKCPSWSPPSLGVLGILGMQETCSRLSDRGLST